MQRTHYVLFLLVLIGIVTIPAISGQSVSTIAQTSDVLLDPISIKAVMDNDGFTIISIDARMTNLGESPISTLTFRLDSLESIVTLARVNGSYVSTTVIEYDRYTEILISLGFSLNTNESTWIELGMLSSDFQSEAITGNDPTKLVSDFIFYVRPSVWFANFTFTAVLPEEALLSQESIVPLFPDTSLNYTDGFSLAFIWFTSSLQPGQERVFIIKYQTVNYATSPIRSFIIELLLVGAIGVIFGIGIAVFGPKIIYRLRRVGRVRFIGVTTEEEEVLEVIRQKGGSCPQKDLYTEFDMSQAKVSLILNNLEERGIVRRFREGRENVVHIMEE
ncbi:hypothetical protein EU527_11790 [Candidatus Thorarchaeota archaeon]|nr:MAG: hypothetical protein EU527_11790 [Candidatus Thorarchaeota archaeon]